MITDAEDSAPAVGDSPGRYLAQVRQSRGLSVERIALELHLKPEIVAAVEKDAYDRLPSAVFVSGYVRAYARLLDIDPQPLIERFHRLHPNAEPPPPRVTSQPGRRVGGSHLAARLLVSSLAVAAIAVLGYWAWQTEWPRMAAQTDEQQAPSSADEDMFDPTPEVPAANHLAKPAAVTETPDAPSALPESGVSSPQPISGPTGGGAFVTDDDADTPITQAAAPAAAAGPEADAPAQSTLDAEAPSMSAQTDIEPPGTPSDGGEGQTTAEQTTADAADEATQSPAADDDEIVLTFSGPCWVDVRDADGEVELFGEMADGDRHVLSGPPPFSLILGNAAAAEVRVGDRVIDVAAIAKGNVARFDLDPDAPPTTTDTGAGSSPAPGGDPSG